MRWPWTKAETELEHEVRHHLESLADAYQRQGMSRDEAERQARIEFGGVERVKDECRDESSWSWLANVSQDARFGCRMMRKTPAITIAAIVSLALGIGATTAILSLANALLWRNVGAPAPEQLIEVLWESKAHPEGLLKGSFGGNFREGPLQVADFFSLPAYEAMRKQLEGKAQVAAHISTTPSSVSVEGRVLISRVRGVSGNFFPALQLQPFAGRLLMDSDDSSAAASVVVVTHRFFLRELGANLNAVGKAIQINNHVYTIAGVLPPAFTGIVPGEETDIYAPIQQSPFMLSPETRLREHSAQPTTWWLQVILRRAPGVTPEQLRPMLDAAFASSFLTAPKSPAATPHVRLSEASRGLGAMRRSIGNPVWMLLGLVSMVLLIACANIANLLLARAATREKEVALRVSLGCDEGRLIRQFFTESLMLAVMGGFLGVGVASFLGTLMVNLIPSYFGGMAISLQPDLRSLLATGAVTLFTAVLFGLYPAWRTARIDTTPALKEGSGSGGSVSRARWLPAKLLVLAQVALGVLLVTSAIIFTSHLNELANQDTGFERSHTVLFDLRPGEVGYKGDRLRKFYFDLEERLARLPGVEAVGIARTRPMRGGGYWSAVTKPGQAKPVHVAVHHANPAFLHALGVPILAGRMMSPQEVRSGAKVAVIGENLRKQLDTNSPLGMRLTMGTDEYTVVGVAREARYHAMDEAPPPVFYIPFDYTLQSATIVARTSIPPLAALGMIRTTVKELDPNVPLVDIYTMEQQISRTLQRERLFAWLCGSFGVLALVLCVVGLYGLMSHTTARRTPEIGIRIALGASRNDVMSQVLWDGMKLAAVGLVLGVPVALYATKIAAAQDLLPAGTTPYVKLAAAIGVLAISALAAVLGPAVRASTVDPMSALRRG